MAYPESYDSIQDLDLAECATFSHILNDGIIDTADSIEMDATYCVYANYGSGDPMISIIDPDTDEFLVANEIGVFLPNSGLHKFCIEVPTDGSAGEGDVVWCEKQAIIKLHSSESIVQFKKHVSIITKSCTPAEMCATLDNTGLQLLTLATEVSQIGAVLGSVQDTVEDVEGDVEQAVYFNKNWTVIG